MSTFRDLGLIFSDNLSWSDHYKVIFKSAYGQLNLIKRTFSNACPLFVKWLLYTSLVRSKLTYCSQVWWPLFLKDDINLERIQCRATKFIVGNSTLNYWDRLISFHLLPLMYFYDYLDILLIQSQIPWWQFWYSQLHHFLLVFYPIQLSQKFLFNIVPLIEPGTFTSIA